MMTGRACHASVCLYLLSTEQSAAWSQVLLYCVSEWHTVFWLYCISLLEKHSQRQSAPMPNIQGNARQSQTDAWILPALTYTALHYGSRKTAVVYHEKSMNGGNAGIYSRERNQHYTPTWTAAQPVLCYEKALNAMPVYTADSQAALHTLMNSGTAEALSWKGYEWRQCRFIPDSCTTYPHENSE